MNERIAIDYQTLQNELMGFAGCYESAYEAMQSASVKRKVFKAISALSGALDMAMPSVRAAIGVAVSELSALNVDSSDWKAISAIDAGREYYKDLTDRIERTGLMGISSGMKKMDDHLGGWLEPDLITVAACSSMGKSAFGIFQAIQAAKQDKRVLYFSTEMGIKQLASRMVAQLSPVTMSVAQWRNMDNIDGTESLHLINKGVLELSDLPIYFDDQAMVTVEEITRRATAHEYSVGCDMIIVDHMHDIVGSKGTPQQDLSHIAKSLKNLAKTLKKPVMMLAQLRKSAAEGGADSSPRMGDIEGAGAIAQASDAILLLHHPYYYDNQLNALDYRIIVEKNRNGERGLTLSCGFHGQTQQFFNSIEDAGKFVSGYYNGRY
jgi:replicative DNA helicase